MLNKQLSICIVGKDGEKYLPECIKCSLKISRNVIYLGLGLDDESKSKASELGASVVDLDSLFSALQSEWVLFLIPNEVPVLTSEKALCSISINSKSWSV